MKALIVDDEGELAAMVAQRLRAAGMDAEIACDGRAGLERARSWSPDVVLLDLSMPELDGWQLCEKLSEDARTMDIPKLLMTAWATKDLERRARQAGVRAVILKPFDERMLATKVASVVRARRRAAR